MQITNNKVICPSCGIPMVLKQTTKYKYKNGNSRKFYGCQNWPNCDCTHGAHPDGRPMGFPVTKEVRELRQLVHRQLEERWGEWRTMHPKRKKKMYDWLKKHTKSGHIGKMGKQELLDLLDKINS